jgi:hypothetical protein
VALGFQELRLIEMNYGRRGWTRTSDHLLRRQVLYPPELRARSPKSLYDECSVL